MMDISAVIVTFNRVHLLKKCLSSLLNQNYKLSYIFVINNNSTDGTTKYLNSLNNSHIIIKNLTKNLGGAGGFSIGLNLAYCYSSSSYFWLMDDDSMPTDTALYQLVKSARLLKNNFGFLSSNVRSIYNNEATNVPITTPDWSELTKYSLIKIKEATFVSFFVTRKCVKRLGLPIAEAFIWGDDTEYTDRISKMYPCYFVPNSIIVHNSKNSTKNIYDENYPRMRFYKYLYRNNIMINKRYYSIRNVIKRVIHISLIFIKIPFKSKNYRFHRMYYVLCGLIEGIFFDPKVKFPNKMKLQGK